MMAEWPKTRTVLSILERRLLAPDAELFLKAVEDYQRLCSTWNLAAKLMSKSDIELRFDEHVADSLSLLPYVNAAIATGARLYVDIGSGGGLPAIPLKLAGIRCPCVMLDRSEKKAEFLRQASSRLDVPDTTVVHQAFEDWRIPFANVVITARATENPARIDSRICWKIGLEGIYLAQRQVDLSATNLHSSPVVDRFQTDGLRRSELHIVASAERLSRFHVEPYLVG